MVAADCIVALSTRTLRHHDLLAQQRTALAATCREQVLLQGSLDGLDEYGTGGSIHYDPAHRTPSVDFPSRRLGLRLIPTASTSMLTVSITWISRQGRPAILYNIFILLIQNLHTLPRPVRYTPQCQRVSGIA